MQSPELLLIGGKPYSGKSTIAKAFASSEMNIVVKHLSMGDRLRGISKGEIPSAYSEILANNDKELRAHRPVAKETPIRVFEEFLSEEPADLVILDAFPRYPDRLEAFKESVYRVGAKVLAVCRVNVNDNVVHARSTSRGQRYEDIQEDKAFVEQRLHDFESGASLVLGELAKDYPYYTMDGAAPLAENVTILQDIYLAQTTRQP